MLAASHAALPVTAHPVTRPAAADLLPQDLLLRTNFPAAAHPATNPAVMGVDAAAAVGGGSGGDNDDGNDDGDDDQHLLKELTSAQTLAGG